MQIDALSWKSYIQAQFEPDLITVFSAFLLATVPIGAYAKEGQKAKIALHP